MANNFSDLGFQMQNGEDFISLANHTVENGKRIDITDGFIAHWLIPCGAEVWFDIDSSNTIRCVAPRFRGESLREVSLTQADIDETDVTHTIIHAESEADTYHLVCNIPDFFLSPKLKFPKKVKIQLTAFASRLSCFDSEKEYYQSEESLVGAQNDKGEPMQYASISFIPTGSFVEKGQKEEPLAMITGKVIKFEKRINDLTNEPFLWILVETLGGYIDVVTDRGLINKEPVKGGFITGEFWLSGRIINK